MECFIVLLFPATTAQSTFWQLALARLYIWNPILKAKQNSFTAMRLRSSLTLSHRRLRSYRSWESLRFAIETLFRRAVARMRLEQRNDGTEVSRGRCLISCFHRTGRTKSGRWPRLLVRSKSWTCQKSKSKSNSPQLGQIKTGRPEGRPLIVAEWASL